VSRLGEWAQLHVANLTETESRGHAGDSVGVLEIDTFMQSRTRQCRVSYTGHFRWNSKTNRSRLTGDPPLCIHTELVHNRVNLSAGVVKIPGCLIEAASLNAVSCRMLTLL
jgi:hypothetical protein